MSRWSENFEAHAFHEALKGYQEDINNLDISDISDLKALDEISRLKKILIFDLITGRCFVFHTN